MNVDINKLRLFAMYHRLWEIQQEKRMRRVGVVIGRTPPPPIEKLVLTARPKHIDDYEFYFNNPIRENHKRPYKYHR